MNTKVISAVGHVALRVRDVEAAVEHATTTMGLRLRAVDGARHYLTEGEPHHSLQYVQADHDAVDHVGLQASSAAALDEIRTRLARRGIPLLRDEPMNDCFQDGLAFVVPGGFVIEVYTGMPMDGPAFTPVGVRPSRFGHVNFGVAEPAPLIDVLTEVLDFRISDAFRGGAFLRCNEEHHGIGALVGPGVLQHHAWEVESIADLGRLGDLLDGRGESLLAGPVRHGMGRNIAAYIQGPANMMIEYYCDMQLIRDDENYVPGTWDEAGHKWFTRWAPQLPDPETRKLGMPPAPLGDRVG